MEDTLTVALRVAEEAIEEAIAKAESYRDSLVRDSSLYIIHPTISSSFIHTSKYPLIHQAFMLTSICSSEHPYKALAYKYHFILQILNVVDSSISQFRPLLMFPEYITAVALFYLMAASLSLLYDRRNRMRLAICMTTRKNL